MSEITQTILTGDPEGRQGNCLQAAVASLFDLELDDVPHFVAEPESARWLDRMCTWAVSRRMFVRYRPTPEGVARGIAVGPTERGTHHANVVRDGRLVWDPHPSRAGLTGVKAVYEFIQED